MSAVSAPSQNHSDSEPSFGFWRRSFGLVVKYFIQ